MSQNFCSPLDVTQIEQNFADINPAMSVAEAAVEANRCLYCYDAPCMHACPTHIDVPSFIKKIATGNLTGSARVIFDANPIGATCARVCPVDVLCEGACVEKTLLKKPIEIGRLQRFATDHAFASGKQIFERGESNGKSVGVVGSGPAGLSCASYLARLGYDVTVYERRPLAGGLDTYGMAEYKMPQSVSLAEVERVAQMGVKFLTNTEIGSENSPPRGGVADASSDGVVGADGVVVASEDKAVHDSSERTTPSAKRGHPSFSKEGSFVDAGSQNVSFSDLEQWHDAIFLGVGLGETNRLNIPGEDHDGVLDALQFIEKIKTRDWMDVPLGKTVAVIGAGNTAIDAVTQAKRLGAERVLLVYRRTEKEASAYAYEFELAKKDGIEFVWKAAPISILQGENGSRLSLRCERTDTLELFDIPCDLVIKAIGQQKMLSFFESVAGVETDEKGRVVLNESMQTSNPKIFAGGDCANGGAEAVDAAQMGKLAAQGIHKSLTGESVKFAGVL